MSQIKNITTSYKSLETLVRRQPGSQQAMASMRERFRAMAVAK